MLLKRCIVLLGLLLVLIPAGAQDEIALTRVTFEQYGFAYPASSRGNQVTITDYPGDPLDQPPPNEIIGYEPKYVEIEVAGLSGFLRPMTVRIMATADLEGYEIEEHIVFDLQRLLEDRPDPTTLGSVQLQPTPLKVPTLPVRGAVQALVGRVQYVETKTLSGVSYVTAFIQNDVPFSPDHSFRWHFLGLSHDGKTLVWLDVKMIAGMFPITPVENESILENYERSLQAINEGASRDLWPTDETFKAMIESLTF